MKINSHKLNFPAYVGWDITKQCNHHCFYCYNYWRNEKTDFLDEKIKTYKEIADFIISKKPAVITLSGGEPLLVFNEIKDQIVRLCENGIHIRILTNGSLISDEIAFFCKSYDIDLIVSFPSVNIDLFSQITKNSSSYDSVIMGMDILYSHQVKFTTNIVVSKKNLKSLEETADWVIRRYHLKKIFISRVTRPPYSSDSFEQSSMGKDDLIKMFKICDRIIKKKKITASGCGGVPFCIFPSTLSLKMFGKSCGAGLNNYIIDMMGNIRVCTRDSRIIGNIYTNDFLEIREKMIKWSERSCTPNICQRCKIKHICNGGCRMTSLDDSRDGESVDCDMNPQNAPKKMPYRQIFVNPFVNYKLQKNINCVCFKNIYRVAFQHHIFYLNKEQYDYLFSRKKVSVLGCVKNLHISYSAAISFLRRLKECEIIKTK